MRLKHLELQGYKTFASRTEFVFDGGITAIVGPNGSGKSNVADAIRWVLGEQSYRTLRAKRTEDMIFSGSALRARMGMATASIVLDNADGWLPIDFSEVTITRRAYRSGENEYLLNGSRVRLRDINELLAKSGLARRTYTVVGQGLVDAVLSLRPEDRRELFEEASGITLYQSKRADAVSRLDETRANLLRINDIINEIAPRLRRLEREAERADHHALLTRQLEGLLRIWYGYRWREEQLNLRRSQDSLDRRQANLDRRAAALEELDQRSAIVRTRYATLRQQLGDWHRESSHLHRSMEQVQRDLAVWRERARLLARRRDELETERGELETRVGVAAGRVSSAKEDVASALDLLRQRSARVAQAQSELDAHEKQRDDLSRQLATARTRVQDLVTRAADRRNRLAQLDEQRGVQEEARAGHQQAIAGHRARAVELQAQIETVAAEEARAQAQVRALEAAAAERQAALDEAAERRAKLDAALAQARREQERLQARYESLDRLRAEGEGLHAGVRAVLQATGRTGLSGILGTAVQLIHVPPEYEIAIEVALGGHLQDVVVETWPDAEAAIAYLRQGQRGRATFLPLDTVRSVSRLHISRDEGLIGIGADLVRAAERLSPVVEMLLGRTVVVRDLPAARRIFDGLQGGFQIVTLAGEVLRSSGSVTGGQGQQRTQGQALAREREWRELPAAVDAAGSRLAEIEAALTRVEAAAERLRNEIRDLGAQQREREKAATAIQARQREAEQALVLVEQQVAWRRDQLATLTQQAAGLDRQEAELRTELEQLAAGQSQAEAEAESLQARLEAFQGEALYRHLSEARTEAAVARGEWEHRRGALENLQERRGQIEKQLAAKQRQLEQLDGEQAALEGQIQEHAARESTVQASLSTFSAKIEPAEAALSALEAEREQLEGEEKTLRTRLRQAESSHNQAVLAHSRQQDRLDRLRRQIMDDFGLVEVELMDGLPEQRLLPLGEMVSSLPVVQTLPEGLEDEIHQLKAQLRRMGSINPGAPEEYGEVLDRYTFLTTQAADLEEAAQSLREVIAELDEVMRREFQATFQEVAARFKENFTELFGGGAARLVLTDPEEISQTGVEVVARPPGKRQQTLALLSGGERSLTAVALVFAILEVSPPPFCVLDEVDAMLDEANVRRFRQALEKLSQHTQFVIITHNRGTIQAADTIYGVSMGEDSISQVISLRLEGDRVATPAGETLDIMKDG